MTTTLIPLIVGLIGVIGTLIATRITARSSHAETYLERMREEDIRQIENTKDDFNVYNEKLLEAFHELDISERTVLVSELRRLRNKINLHFPAFDLSSKYNLYENELFKDNGNIERDRRVGLKILPLIHPADNDDAGNNKFIVDKATFLLMSLLEDLLEQDFRNTNVDPEEDDPEADDEQNIVSPLYLQTLLGMLFKLQQSLYHIRRLAVRERTDHNFLLSENEKIIYYVREVEYSISKEYSEFFEQMEQRHKEKDIVKEEIVKEVVQSKEENMLDQYIMSPQEVQSHSVETIVRHTLEKLLEDELNLIVPWKPEKAKRYLLNTSFHHSDGKKFENPKLFEHEKLDQAVYFEANSSKENIINLLERYITQVLEDNKEK